jgi:hypothetical protein
VALLTARLYRLPRSLTMYPEQIGRRSQSSTTGGITASLAAGSHNASKWAGPGRNGRSAGSERTGCSGTQPDVMGHDPKGASR